MEDEDLEEMKFLRDKYKLMAAREERQVVGYKFDMNSKHKREQSVPKGLTVSTVDKSDDGHDQQDSEMAKVMGFATFGRNKSLKKNETKTARKFDIETLMSERPITNKWKPLGQSDDNIDEQTNVTNDNQIKASTSDESKAVTEIIVQKETKLTQEDDSDSDLIGPPLPPGFSLDSINKEENNEDNDDEDDDEEDDDEDYEGESGDRYHVLPISHEIELTHGTKSVISLALDPNGSRLVSGSVDYEMKFWDFQGMDSSLQSFRSTTPCECHPIKNLEFSANGDVILVISGACIAKIVDRDGFVKNETLKGDQYITDMNHTKGHIAMLNSGVWHPRDRQEFATCSNDGTCRLWDIENIKNQKTVIKARSSGGLRAIPNTCRYTRNADLISVGCNDGSIQMWDTRRSFINTSALVRDSHLKGSEISCIQFSYDGNGLLSRGTDDTLKLWDMKMLKKPIIVINELYNRFSMTDCFFSPDDKLLVTGVSCRKGEDYGRLMFYSRDTSELSHEITVNKGAVIRSAWHPKLNQLVVGSSNGSIKVYYDTNRSERGAKLCVVKHRRKYKESFENIDQQIIAPHSLPLFKTERRKPKRLQELKDRKNPLKSHRPELPVMGPGQGGRIASAGNTFASFIARNLGVKNKIDDSIDAREAILRHAKEAAENPYWVSPAYTATQPKPVFANETKDEDEDDEPSAKRPHIPV
ncbi:WD repeat-containing protein 70-like [Oppia nitens]|uniref:WD repeat-containing protein 70-like n=1 Tax=Oppia nitens TaxID=1686743 RepID=UPI0023DB9A48|nr:WD repeat-containing protein 70-like [Oppia nitens]